MKIIRRFGKYEMVMDRVKSKAKAAELIKYYEKRDHYEIEVEKYQMPESWNGKFPEYYITK